MKYYAVIDTNVLVSAMLKHHSVPGSIIDLAFDGPIIPVLNDAIEKEYREVLSRPKFHLPSDLIEDILSSFHQRVKGGFMSMQKNSILNFPIRKTESFMKSSWKNGKMRMLIW